MDIGLGLSYIRFVTKIEPVLRCLSGLAIKLDCEEKSNPRGLSLGGDREDLKTTVERRLQVVRLWSCR
jgi:hypothetical protein